MINGLIDLLVAGAIGLAIYGLVHFPGLRAGWSWVVYLGLFLGIVAGYALTGAHLGRLASPATRWAGVLAGTPAAVCGWWIGRSNGGLIGFAAVFVIAVPSVIVAVAVVRRQRRADQASVAVICAALTAGLLTFVSYVATTYATLGPPTASLLQEFAHSGAHDYRSWVVGDDLGGAVFLLLFVPALAIGLGLLAARLAAPSRPASAAAT
jgi:hypothetical protein